MGFKIGNIELKNRMVLAPMAGISDPPYMHIVEEMGVALAFTELISAEGIVRENKKTFDMLNGIDTLNIPIGIQIFGSNAKVLSEAAKILVSRYKVSLIDINMGCPVPKVAIHSASGSALLKDPSKVYEIVKEVKSAVDVPVTVKIRSGWNEKSINAVEVARKIESAGADAITVHARTRSQGYTGQADWNIIKAVKEAVNIPVIGNGDVTSPEDYTKMIETTRCDAVMIGRGALGNPWLFKQIEEYISAGEIETIPSLKDKIDMIKRHYELLSKYKSVNQALLEIRSHVLWYLKGTPGCAEVKSKVCASKSSEEIFDILDDYYKKSTHK